MNYFENYKLLENVLLFKRDYIINNPSIIEYIYSVSLINCNQQIISLLNLFVRDNCIKISRMNIIKYIYHINHPNSYLALNDLPNTELDYLHKYWNCFDIKI